MERRIFLRSGLALGAIGALELLRPGQLMAGSCYSRLAKPSLSCLGSTGTTITLQLCAGMNGAPGGFTIEWMFSSDYVANGKSWVAAGDPKLFYAAFVPAGCKSKYSLSKLQCLPITIGGLVVGNGVSTNGPGPLVAGTAYVFRAYANSYYCYGKSDYSATVECATVGNPPPPPPI